MLMCSKTRAFCSFLPQKSSATENIKKVQPELNKSKASLFQHDTQQHNWSLKQPKLGLCSFKHLLTDILCPCLPLLYIWPLPAKTKNCFVISNYFGCPKSNPHSWYQTFAWSSCYDIRRYEVWRYRTPCWLSRTISKGERCSEKQNKTIHATTKIFKELSDPVIFSSLKKQERTERHPWCVG